MKGRVALWNNSTNCGFIEVNDEELFVHIKEQNIHIYEDEIIELYKDIVRYQNLSLIFLK